MAIFSSWPVMLSYLSEVKGDEEQQRESTREEKKIEIFDDLVCCLKLILIFCAIVTGTCAIIIIVAVFQDMPFLIVPTAEGLRPGQNLIILWRILRTVTDVVMLLIAIPMLGLTGPIFMMEIALAKLYLRRLR